MSQDGRAPMLRTLEADWKTARHGDSGWPLFLESIKVSGIRGWTGQQVEFRFPVVALCGENGSGKSTVLKSAATAYKLPDSSAGAQTFNPDDFFPSTPWEHVSGAEIEFTIRRGPNVLTDKLRKPTERWRGMPDRSTRTVYFLDISRTQPIDTLIGYGRVARESINGNGQLSRLSSESVGVLSRVMNRTYTAALFQKEAGKAVGILGTKDRTYSNFHQGAGEDTTFDLMEILEKAPRNSLIIIDEVEASLHPRAQRRLVNELIDVARKSRVQFILSTHSAYVLEQLPPEARILIQTTRDGGKQVVYGASPEYALSAIDDERHYELTVFCEDGEAATMIDTLLRRVRPGDADRIRITPVGPANTVREMGKLAASKLLPFRAIAVCDADQRESEGCVLLPGTLPPEKEIFNSFQEKDWIALAERLGVQAGSLMDAADDATRLPEHHTWIKRLAERLGATIRPSKVWDSAVDVWVRDVVSDDERSSFTDRVLASLPPLPQ